MLFPEKFTLAKRDLKDFSGSVAVGNAHLQKKGIPGWPVQESRFGCYTLQTSTKWAAHFRADCPDGMVVNSGAGAGFQQDSIYLCPMFGDSEYPPVVLSAWAVRGDSLDFIAILDKCFGSEGWATRLHVDSLETRSPTERRISGRISWDGYESHRPDKRVVRKWSATWTLPGKMVFE